MPGVESLMIVRSFKLQSAGAYACEVYNCVHITSTRGVYATINFRTARGNLSEVLNNVEAGKRLKSPAEAVSQQ